MISHFWKPKSQDHDYFYGELKHEKCSDQSQSQDAIVVLRSFYEINDTIFFPVEIAQGYQESVYCNDDKAEFHQARNVAWAQSVFNFSHIQGYFKCRRPSNYPVDITMRVDIIHGVEAQYCIIPVKDILVQRSPNVTGNPTAAVCVHPFFGSPPTAEYFFHQMLKKHEVDHIFVYAVASIVPEMREMLKAYGAAGQIDIIDWGQYLRSGTAEVSEILSYIYV